MIHGKIILQGALELLSPTLIGSGRDDVSDIDVLLDVDEKPFIPATSLIGVLRQTIRSDEIDKNDLKRFWGFIREDKISKQEQQSVVRCSDLLCQSRFSILRRDGIKIDHKTGIVEDKGKYDYQLIDRGAKFGLNLETDYSKATQEFVTRMMVTIAYLLEHGSLRIGAKTNNGLGQVTLRKKEFYVFDFSEKKDVLNWLTLPKDRKLSSTTFSEDLRFPVKNREFVIDATFDLKSSLIVRSYATSPDMPDAVNVQSNDSPVIPGSSLKGAMRARAEKILKTLEKPENLTQNILRNLFGYVDESHRATDSVRGKIRVDEVVLSKCLAELHHRIKIDRFSGGTIESALFDTRPVFTNFDDKVQNIKISIQDYEDYEAGLLLLVLKDLWTGDLAVGGEKNIGRGVFQGCWAEIAWDGQEPALHLNENFTVAPDKARGALEEFVNALNHYAGEEGNDNA